MKNKLDTIEKALHEIRRGRLVIVVDDEDRENEGDFIGAAETITAEIVNFMTKYGRGLICAAITEKRCKELNLELMVANNTALHETQFTVSVDLKGHGCTTGISAPDRAKTLLALADDTIKPEDLGRPGHIFPLKAVNGGVLKRAGHTEASVDLTRLAGLKPVATLVEIMNEDGTMARLPELFEISEKTKIKIISIKDLIAYRLKNESLIEKVESVDLPTVHGNFKLVAFQEIYNKTLHLALVKGEWVPDDIILVRVHSSCLTGDVFHSSKCDCGNQLDMAIKAVEKAGKGIVLYLNQEGRGIGLLNKLRAYHLQEEGYDTVEANVKLGFKPDERNYGIGAQMLRFLGAKKIKLISNNPSKKVGLSAYEIEITDTIPLIIKPNKHNKCYLKTKQDKLGHNLNL